MAKEEGVTPGPLMNEIQKNHGLSANVDDLLAGKFVTEHEVSGEMAVWIETVNQTEKERNTPKVVEMTTKEQFQKSFKIANGKTSSSPAEMHYRIWKAMPASDYWAEFQCIMISLPFVYGFANARWLRGIDVVLEKKKGVKKNYLLRIIGVLEADLILL